MLIFCSEIIYNYVHTNAKYEFNTTSSFSKFFERSSTLFRLIKSSCKKKTAVLFYQKKSHCSCRMQRPAVQAEESGRPCISTGSCLEQLQKYAKKFFPK